MTSAFVLIFLFSFLTIRFIIQRTDAAPGFGELVEFPVDFVQSQQTHQFPDQPGVLFHTDELGGFGREEVAFCA